MIAQLIRRAGLLVLLVIASPPARADQDGDTDRLIELLQFSETVEIMREEGLKYGADVGQEMLPDADTPTWQSTVARIYDADKMLALISEDFRIELREADLGPMLTYFSGEEGREIMQLEIDARRAFLDADTEAAAIEHYNRLRGEDAAVVAQIEQVISDSDLVEFNVMGALNSSLMFYRGLSDGGAYDASEAEMLTDVWAQEDETRRSSREWLGAFLTLAYQPLESEKLDRYAEFYRTPEGRELNRAIFATFDRMYEELSYLLGLAVADHMTSEPL